MIARILFAAILAGFAAGVFVTGVQTYKVIPLILEAETYEGQPAAGHEHGRASTPEQEAVADDGHSHGAGVWAPQDGMERLFFTLMANIVTGVAFGFLLTAAVVLSGRKISLGQGVLWGVGGFLAFSLAPSLGLPPELPGMPAGDLGARQMWWWSTVVLTAGGLALLALPRNFAFKALGVALIVVPHVVGAPAPESHATAVPAGLAAEFASATLAMSALFWIVLGAVAGWFLARADQHAEA